MFFVISTPGVLGMQYKIKLDRLTKGYQIDNIALNLLLLVSAFRIFGMWLMQIKNLR